MGNFEKHIQSSADSFKMDPAEGSFDQVMKALEKKKKRRFLFWLWFLIPGILVAGVWIGISEITNHTITALHSHHIHLQDSYTSSSAQTEHSANISTISEKEQSSNSSDLKTGSTKNQSSQLDERTIGNSNNNIQPDKSVNTSVATKTTTKITGTNTTSDPNKKIKKSSTNSQNNYKETKVSNEPITTHVGSTNTENNSTLTSENKVVLNPNLKSEPVAVNTNHPEMMITGTNTQRNFSVLPAFNFPRVKTEIKPLRFAVGAYAQMGTMKNIFINNRDSTGEAYASNREETDINLFSWTGGLSFRYTPKSWLSIETGVAYSRYSSVQNVGTGFMPSSSTQDVETADSVYTFGNVQNSILPGLQQDYVNEYDFLSIPVKVYFQKKWNWIGIEGGVGVAMDIPVYTRSFTVQPNNSFSTFTSNVGDSKLAVGLQFSTQLHATFHVSRWSFYAGPVFRIRATSMYTSDYAIRQHYYFVGAETGVRFNF